MLNGEIKKKNRNVLNPLEPLLFQNCELGTISNYCILNVFFCKNYLFLLLFLLFR